VKLETHIHDWNKDEGNRDKTYTVFN